MINLTENCVLRVGDKEFLINDVQMTVDKDVTTTGSGTVIDEQTTITFKSPDEIIERERTDQE